MIKRLSLILIVFVASGMCELFTLGGYTLMSSPAEARTKSVSMELKDSVSTRKTYTAQNGNKADITLSFVDDQLQFIIMHLGDNSYQDYVQIVSEFALVQGRPRDVNITPNPSMPGYVSSWNTEWTSFIIFYNTKDNRISVSLGVKF